MCGPARKTDPSTDMRSSVPLMNSSVDLPGRMPGMEAPCFVSCSLTSFGSRAGPPGMTVPARPPNMWHTLLQRQKRPEKLQQGMGWLAGLAATRGGGYCCTWAGPKLGLDAAGTQGGWMKEWMGVLGTVSVIYGGSIIVSVNCVGEK